MTDVRPDSTSPTLAAVHRGAPELPSINVRLATAWSFVAAVYVALSEINHVLSQVVREGRSWSPNQLGAISSLFHPGTATQGWDFFDNQAPRIAANADVWLVVYALVDLALVAGYVHLVWRMAWAPERSLRRWGARLVMAGGVFDAAEDAVIMIGHPHSLIVFFTYLKWFGLGPGLLVLLVSVGKQLRPIVGGALHALYTHRYTLGVVLPLVVLGLASGTDILEQLPDIQRRWFDDGVLGGLLAGLVAAAFILTLVGASMLYVGRQRTDALWLRTCEDWTADKQMHPHGSSDECPARKRQLEAPDPALLVWFVGPVVLAILAGIAWLLDEPVRILPFIGFCVAPLALGGSSMWMRKKIKAAPADHAGNWPPKRPTREPVSIRRFRATALMGDVLVGLIAVVAGLGSIRAFTGLLLLDPHQKGNYGMVAFGLAAVLATWTLHARLLRWLAARSGALRKKVAAREGGERAQSITWRDRSLSALTPGIEVLPVDAEGKPVARSGLWDTLTDQRWTWVVLGGTFVILVATASLPRLAASLFGVIGTFELALGCLSLVVAATVILLQRGGAPEVFWLVGIPYAPVTTLLVVSAVFAGTRSTGVHDIREFDPHHDHAEVQASDRPTVDQLFQKWLDDGQSCGVRPKAKELQEVQPTLDVRPMLLYAAEGGGIRAAYWTTRAVDRIGAARTLDGKSVEDICRSAFLSSGASGGSVGLTIASVSDLGGATSQVKHISGPTALARATDGLVLRDTLYAATGVPLPSFGGPDQPPWADRGTLIEQSWESVDDFDDPFLVQPDAWQWKAPGALVINSTSTTTACRTLVSQVQVTSSPGVCTTGVERPVDGALSAANSTDLLSCTNQLRSVTAALLTARFPYVTPSGVVHCRDDAQGIDKKLQIVDGGYAENFGLGTLVDLGPQLMNEVRRHNDCVLRRLASNPCEGALVAPSTLVVPMVVYLDNGSGTDLVQQPGGLDLEVLVPPLTLLEAKKELYSAPSQLARATEVFGTDQLWDQTLPAAADAASLVDGVRKKGPVALVFQATQPQVAAPLGWVLSEASMRSMNRSICGDSDDVAEALNPTDTPEDTPAELTLDASLADVMSMLPGKAEKCVADE